MVPQLLKIYILFLIFIPLNTDREGKVFILSPPYQRTLDWNWHNILPNKKTGHLVTDSIRFSGSIGYMCE